MFPARGDVYKRQLYDRAYKIFSIEEIYLILINGYDFTEEMVNRILLFQGNILEQIYEEWIGTDYSHQDACLLYTSSGVELRFRDIDFDAFDEDDIANIIDERDEEIDMELCTVQRLVESFANGSALSAKKKKFF